MLESWGKARFVLGCRRWRRHMGNTGWRSPTMIEIGKRTLLIGERINPTGRQRLASQLEAGKLELVIEEARAQAAEGAYAIDVNVGALGVDEVELLPRAALVVLSLIHISEPTRLGMISYA